MPLPSAQVHKRYQAVVWGLLAAQEGAWNEINLPIAADWERRPLRVIDPHTASPA
jgi:tRNA pseudouridine32 synthase/23S rRNA pseudouridine746 synthase